MVSESETKQTPLEAFEAARAAHTDNMKKYNAICNDITRCENERQAAKDAGKEAEASWRTRFRNLRGNLTDELRDEHSKRIANRELAEEFTDLIEELDIDKSFTMMTCCNSGKEYISAFEEAFRDATDSHWLNGFQFVNPKLLWAIRMRLHREEILPSHGENGTAFDAVAKMVGRVLTDAALSLPLSTLEELPEMKKIGMRRPALTGLDWKIQKLSPLGRVKMGEALRARRKKLSEKKAS